MSESVMVSNSSGLPSEIQELEALSKNFYWVWNRSTRKIFEEIDSKLWEATGHNPVILLQRVPRARLEDLAKSPEFTSKINKACANLVEYRSKGFLNTWYQRNYSPSSEQLVAYFSAEFGITECLKIYSGGLGILAGDHLKSASDLGIPLVGVGLFYRNGYFSQQVTSDGWQIENYPENIPPELPLELVRTPNSNDTLIISVPINARQIRIRAWRAEVGRIPLLLIDSNLPDLNSKEDCEVTSQLYGGDIQTRIQQEILLGMGGAKLLEALGFSPTIYHMNEGHAAFVILERIRRMIEDPSNPISFEEAKARVSQANVFTTHTPVSAGIDVFDRSLIEKYLGWYCARIGINLDTLMEMGHDGPSHGAGFNMAVFALKYSDKANAVSRLHRTVATKLWKDVLDKKKSGVSDLPDPEIQYVTNGIHTPSWISDSFANLYDQYLGKNWMESIDDPAVWAKVDEIPDELIWRIHCAEKSRLIEYAFDRATHENGNSEGRNLSRDALTIGFGRRFATYKRASLLLHERDKLSRLLRSNSRPVQFIFAGKAHPRDHEGKRVIQEIINFAKSAEGNGRIVFLADYDISTARRLLQGVDVWLNNPRKPLEACGTSGMKAISNGVLNFSVLDGWWDEAYSSETGWAIGDVSTKIPRHIVDHLSESNDKADAESLYNVLENQIMTEFFDKNENGLPTKWIARMKRSIIKDSVRFNTRRMVIEYAKLIYFDKLSPRPLAQTTGELGSTLLDQASLDWN
jgi:glycogen phosphorylase